MAEDEPTQQATQLVMDPRRLGHGDSGFNDEDLSDIFCILHPSSIPAHKATALIHADTPQHTINAERNVKIREKIEGPHLEHSDIGTFDLAEQGIHSCDLALRLSANLKSPADGGFLFGRNKARCDIVVGQDDEVKRVSNIHFRIYINEYGVLMIEDQSTNGTMVDGDLLRAKDKENGLRHQHTLQLGSIIILTMTPPEEDFRFIVRIPQRDDAAETAFQVNLTNYFHRQNQAQAEKKARHKGIRQPLDIFATPDVDSPNQSVSSVGRYIKEWRGGSKYNKVRTIGKGAFAVVYLITAKYDGVPYAAKELEKRRFMKNGVLDQKVDMEMKIMSKIQHANIVRYVEHVDWEDYLYIIMEYIPGGDLGSLINRHGSLPELEVKMMASQLLSALKYLHTKGITHRDVKPDNILIYSRSPFHVKLTDFGLSKMVDSEETFLRTFCGTLLYCAPEVYSEYREYDRSGQRTLRGVDRKQLPQQRYGHAVDIWSLAGVLFYSLCGSPPYPAKNGITYQELLNNIMSTALDIRPLQKANVSDHGIRFVRAMLHIDPRYRADIPALETYPWLTGGGGMESSFDSMDEVDMIGENIEEASTQLEEGASQLSLYEPEIGDSGEHISDLTELQQPEIPSSFDTSEGASINESYGFMKNGQNNTSNPRLFGEVDPSALGSSGAIPFALPRPEPHVPFVFQSHSFSRASLYDPNEFEDKTQDISVTQEAGPMDTQMPPPEIRTQHIISLTESGNSQIDERAVRSSSLMGAESMVGHLNMHSPSEAASPLEDARTEVVTKATTEFTDIGVSLRRRREDEDEVDLEWRPSELPAKRRRKSTREMDLSVPKSYFWDPKDKSTHHRDYPVMSMSEHKALIEYAAKKGEKFTHGQNVFETTMHSFRASRSPSLEPEAMTRAHSEPTKDTGRRLLMQRDERKLSDESIMPDAQKRVLLKDTDMPDTEHGSHEPENISLGDKLATNVPSSAVQPVVGNDFQPPKRILGKIISLPDSCLPTINLNVTETVTSWGRGFKNTIRYSNGQDIRVPKYAFKIFLFKPDFYTAEGHLPNNITPGNGKNSADQDMTFYISTKASWGIFINRVKLTSHDPQNPNTPAKSWGELRHGDIITAWQHDLEKSQHIRFRFECYWGKSKEPRPEHERFQVLPEGPVLTEIEHVCLTQEKEMLADMERREREEKLALFTEEKKKTKSLNTTHPPQLIVDAPASA